MDHTDKIVRDAIDKRREGIRAIAADNKAEKIEIAAIQGWDKLPVDVTDAQIAIALVVAQNSAANVYANVLQALDDKLNEMGQKEQGHLTAIL